MLRHQALETLPEAREAGFDFTPVDRIVGWSEVPRFIKMGRSALLELAEPLAIPTVAGKVTAHLLKIKGVGLCDHRGLVEPPSTDHYHRIHPHLGFTREGDFVAVRSRVAPLGGITLEMARAEYEIAEVLMRRGCPAQIPLRLYLYDEPDLVFRPGDGGHDQPLGAVVSALPSTCGARADQVFDYGAEPDRLEPAVRAELDGWAASLGVAEEEPRSLTLLREVGAGYARSLRSFHEAGFYRYSGMADNYAYSVAARHVYLIDLDSSRRLTECTAVEAPLQILRDAASALYGLTAHMLRRYHIIRYPPSEVRRARFYPTLVGGYFHDAPWAAVEETAELLDEHFERIWSAAESRHATTPDGEAWGSQELSYVEYRKSRRQQYWLDRKATYSFFVMALRELYDQSGWAKRYPQQLDREDMLRRIAAYAGPATEDQIRLFLSPELTAAF